MALVIGLRTRALLYLSKERGASLFRSVARAKSCMTKRASRRLASFGVLSTGIYVFLNFETARCTNDDYPNGDPNDKPDPISELINKFSPAINKLGVGGLIGICTGYASKRIGKEFAFMFGVGYLVLQVAFC